jgi:hypothetical protein
MFRANLPHYAIPLTENAPSEPGSYLLRIVFLYWPRSEWRVMEFFAGKWILEGEEFTNDDEFELTHWYYLPMLPPTGS